MTRAPRTVFDPTKAQSTLTAWRLERTPGVEKWQAFYLATYRCDGCGTDRDKMLRRQVAPLPVVFEPCRRCTR